MGKRVSPAKPYGKVTQLKWVDGLDAPKDMGIFGGLLYVTDISKNVDGLVKFSESQRNSKKG